MKELTVLLCRLYNDVRVCFNLEMMVGDSGSSIGEGVFCKE